MRWDKKILNDENISISAKGLSHYMINDDREKFSCIDLCKLSRELKLESNYRSILNFLKELIENGYCERVKSGRKVYYRILNE